MTEPKPKSKYLTLSYWKCALDPLNSTAGFVLPHALVLILIGLVLFFSGVFVQHNAHLIPEVAFHPSTCNFAVGPDQARCFSEVVNTPNFAHPNAVNSPPYAPDVFHTAYTLPCRPGGPIQPICSQPSGFGPETIAIVDATGDPSIEADLAAFDARYGLPSCTTQNGCFSIRNQNGGESNLPGPNGWQTEIALDVETAHGVCQTCKIVLYEADSAGFGELATAVDTAASQGATVISNSYGAGEGDTTFAAHFNHPGIAIVASSGDSGYGIESPANFPTVLSAGGTNLAINGDGTWAAEGAWSKGGSGCSGVFPANSWQLSAPNWSKTSCGNNRSVADVSADADPASGVAIYSQGSWMQVGGTSLSSPLLAGIIALGGGVAGQNNPSQSPYTHLADFRDITQGTNGTCSGTVCTAGAGYDGPTGIGSPKGDAGFGGVIVPIPAPTPKPTNTPGPKPTSTPAPKPTATSPPKKSTFPVAIWNRYRTTHHLLPLPYRKANGTLGTIASSWFHSGMRCGGAKAREYTYYDDLIQAFERGYIIVHRPNPAQVRCS